MRLPMRSPVATIILARCSASSVRFINAPEPVLTSSTNASIPSASFLLMMLAQISGGLSTVPVTSRNAYILLSAGTISAVCPTMAHPQAPRTLINSAGERLTLNPGMDSSLSSVPPVWPSPRPLIIGTDNPPAATTGARISDVLSPTPPVECLSTFAPGTALKSITWPDFNIASVKAAVSASVIPRSKTAIIHADI